MMASDINDTRHRHPDDGYRKISVTAVRLRITWSMTRSDIDKISDIVSGYCISLMDI